MKRLILLIILIAIFVAIVFLGYNFIYKKDVKEKKEIIKAEETVEKDSKKSSKIPVKVIKLRKGDLPLRLKISANVDTWEKATVKSRVNGKIEKIYKKIGDYVKKGEIIVLVDDKEAKLELERAKNAKLKAFSNFLVKEGEFSVSKKNVDLKKLNDIKKKYLKALEDFNNGKISEKKFESIKEEYEREMIFSGLIREEIRKVQEGVSDAVVQVKQAEINLKRTKIRAPFNGIISELKVSKGENLSAGQEVFRIINLDKVYLKGYALESEVSFLKKGQRVRIKYDSFPDKYFYGRILSISPEIDSEKKTVTVYVTINNKNRKILPGMNAEIDIEYKIIRDVFIVPRKAVIFRQERPLIFVVKDNIALWKYVKLGEHNDEDVIVNGEISEGDDVVIEGQLTLAHQSRVKIIK